MVIEALGRLFFPHSCVGCGQWDEVLCASCEAVVIPRVEDIPSWSVFALEGDAYPHTGVETSVGHWSVGAYAGILRSFLLAAKHRPDVKLEDFLLRSGMVLGQSMGRSVLFSLGKSCENLWVIPAPSRVRRRLSGREVALPFAVGVARGLSTELGNRCEVVEVCSLRWGAGSQSGRSGVERRLGRHGSMRKRCEVDENVGLVLVDDIVTTGATIREMARCCAGNVCAVGSLCTLSR